MGTSLAGYRAAFDFDDEQDPYTAPPAEASEATPAEAGEVVARLVDRINAMNQKNTDLRAQLEQARRAGGASPALVAENRALRDKQEQLVARINAMAEKATALKAALDRCTAALHQAQSAGGADATVRAERDALARKQAELVARINAMAEKNEALKAAVAKSANASGQIHQFMVRANDLAARLQKANAALAASGKATY